MNNITVVNRSKTILLTKVNNDYDTSIPYIVSHVIPYEELNGVNTITVTNRANKISITNG